MECHSHPWLLMHKIHLTFHLKLRRTCRHAVWRSSNPNEMQPSHRLWLLLAFGVLWPIWTANKSDPLIDPLLFPPPVNNNTVEEGGPLFFPPGAKCPADATEWSQHSGGSSGPSGSGHCPINCGVFWIDLSAADWMAGMALTFYVGMLTPVWHISCPQWC